MSMLALPEPEQAHRILKKRSSALCSVRSMAKVKHSRLLDAIAVHCGLADACQLKALIDGEIEPDEESLGRLTRLLGLLAEDLSAAAALHDADGEQLEAALRALAGHLEVKESALLNGAAVAWCVAGDWQVVRERVTRHRQQGAAAR